MVISSALPKAKSQLHDIVFIGEYMLELEHSKNRFGFPKSPYKLHDYLLDQLAQTKFVHIAHVIGVRIFLKERIALPLPH